MASTLATVSLDNRTLEDRLGAAPAWVNQSVAAGLEPSTEVE